MEPGQLIAQRFEIVRRAGAGGMGTVYEARDRDSGDAVALKLLDLAGDAARARFGREAQLLGEIAHPGVVRYIAHGTLADDRRWLAMAWLPGESLARRLERGPLTIAETLLLGARIAEALAAVHARGIVHRDVKPANILLRDGALGEATLIDFGLARAGGRTRLTAHGTLLGTPEYIAPEQARGSEVDARADVFSLGCVLMECLTGQPPFVADHDLAVLAKILFDETPRLAEMGVFPAELDALITRMLAKVPEQRPADGAAVAAELANLDAASGAPAPPRPAVPASLTTDEQRLLSVILAGRPSASAETIDVGAAPTMTSDATAASGPTLAVGPAPDADALRALAANHGARLERLQGGALVATVSEAATATDQAARAARLALALARRGALPLALASGRGVVLGRLPVSHVVDRAAALLEGAPEAGIRIDDLTASLLDARFDVTRDAGGALLLGERDEAPVARTLLGHATPCVGRDRELATLRALIGECVAEPIARAVLVTAPAGFGKTRVRHELFDRAENQLEVFLGRGDPLSAGAPLAILRQAVRRGLGLFDGEAPEAQQARVRARLERCGRPELTPHLCELAGVPGDDASRAETRRDPLLAGRNLKSAFEDWLDAETTRHPIALVLDDLHWGDAASLKLIDGALARLSDRPLLVIGFARPELHAGFPELWRERGVEEVRLGQLTRRAAERLVREVLADVAPDAMARAIELAGGNAFYLEELIRALADGKRELPESIVATVQTRLDALEPGARRVLRAASIFGGSFWDGALEPLVADQVRDLPRWLGVLVDREVIQPRATSRFPGQREYTFRHALVREAAHAMLTEADLRLGHALAGRWLLEAGEREALVLAEHFERGGVAGEAQIWYRRAAEQAMEANAFGEAVSRAERGLSLSDDAASRLELLFLQIEARVWSGEAAATRDLAERALALAADGSDAWFRALAAVANAAGKVGDNARLIGAAERLAEQPVAAETLEPHIIGVAHIVFDLLSGPGRYDLADRLLARLESAAAGGVSERASGSLHEARGMWALANGDLGRAAVEMEAAAALFARIGDHRRASRYHGNCGFIRGQMGDYAAAEVQLRDCIVEAERMRLSDFAAYARHNLGDVLARRGELAEARAVESEAIRAFEAQAVPRMVGSSRTYLAEILALSGDLPSAIREAEAAVAALVDVPPSRAQALGTLADVLLQAGRPADALAAARDAHQLIEDMGGTDEGEAVIRLAYAQALHASGDAAAAAAAITRARDRLLERATRLSDDTQRQRFLGDVRENARTLALARAWLAR